MTGKSSAKPTSGARKAARRMKRVFIGDGWGSCHGHSAADHFAAVGPHFEEVEEDRFQRLGAGDLHLHDAEPLASLTQRLQVSGEAANIIGPGQCRLEED